MSSMKAVIIGPGNVASQTQMIAPEAVKGHAVVQLTASALNHRDVWITKGQYPGIKEGAVMGSDGCGLYRGKEVILNPGLAWGLSEACQGDQFRVLGVPDNGTFADFISIPEEYLLPKPVHLSCLEAAALPLAGVTAYRSLISRAKAKAGERVLVTGIGGGVALMAMQFAVALHCEVYVTSSDQEKIKKAVSMGAMEGALYTDEGWHNDFLNKSGGFDVIIDGSCGSSFPLLLKMLRAGGRLAFYGATAGSIPPINPQLVFWKQLSILGSTMGSPSDFQEMVDFVTLHSIVPVIDQVFSLQDAGAAFRRMAEGRQFGKIVFDHSI
ncbi:MAG: zinc-binding dehydrogenase [Saprospiraceae bacterium]|nr:zinc-binding dehydrogenase [Saprospiraceae bacterium]